LDTKQHMYTVRFLEELTAAQKDRTGDIRQFVRTFTAVSTRLKTTGILSEYREVQLFLGGLHRNLARKLVTKFKLDVNVPESVQGKFEQIRQEAQDYCLGDIRTEEMIHKGEFSSEGLIEQILEQPVEKARTFSSAPAQRVQQQQQALHAQRSTRDPDLAFVIDDISKRMEAMVLRQQTQFLEELHRANQRQPQVYSAPASGMAQRQPQVYVAPASGANSTPVPGIRGFVSDQQYAPPRRCIFCGDATHLKAQCQALAQKEGAGLVHRVFGRLHWGAAGSGGGEITPYEAGKSMLKRVEESEQQGPGVRRITAGPSPRSTPSFGVRIARMDETDSDNGEDDGEDDSEIEGEGKVEDEDQDEDEDDPEAMVYVSAIKPARVEKRRPTAEKKRVEDLQRKIEQQSRLPAPRVSRPRAHPPAIVETIDMDMDPCPPPAPAKSEKKAKREKPTASRRSFRSDIADATPEEDIFRRIAAEKSINISLAELASVSPSFKRYLYGKATPSTPPSAQASKAQSARVRRAKEVEYAAESGLLPITINGVELRPTGDSGSEINRMGWSEFESLGLPYDDSIEWAMTGITGHSAPLSCCIHEAPVKIGGVTIHTSIFASPGEEGEFILGRPFERAALMQWENRPDGSLWGTVWSSDRARKATFLAVSPKGYTRTSVRDTASGSWQRKGRGSGNGVSQ
jgi:hypothetical protein